MYSSDTAYSKLGKRSDAFLRASNRSLAISLFVLGLLVNLVSSRSLAQGSGISSDGRDYYIGYMPGLNFTLTNPYYVLIGSYADNTVTISYFNESGVEVVARTLVFTKTETKLVTLDRLQMRPTKPGEILEYKSAHIQSKLPISVQCYSEGQITGGMYLALPTPALGKKYVIASYNDNPTISGALQSGWQGQNLKDSSSSMFMVIAPFDNTTVQITPNSTTYAGNIGVNSGEGHTGVPHPFAITMRKGQTYWVRSNPSDRDNDLSGTVVTADKPIAVVAGHERALLGDPSGIWHFMDNDFRDMMIEQMTPIEAWEAEGNVSIPFMPPMNSSTRMLENGRGDMYRVFQWGPAGGNADVWIGGITSPYTYQLAQYQWPTPQVENVEQPVNVIGKDGRKIYVVMYDMFQGIHDSDPGKGPAGGKGDGAQSGGGDSTLESTNYTCPNEMNIVPESRWRRSAIFMAPSNANYRGAQFINVITYKDGLPKIMMKGTQTDFKPLTSWSPSRGSFQIPLRPDLIGLRIQIPAGSYMIKSDSPFVCYSYGRTEGWYKNNFGYAAPVGQALGSKSETYKPRMKATPDCSSWDVKVYDSRPNDEGIADIMLLDDPDGIMARPAHVSFNTRLFPDNPDFVGGDSVVNFKVLVRDPLKDGYAAVYVIDKAGNDTVFEFFYTAPKVAMKPDVADMRNTLVETQACKTFTFYNNSTLGGQPLHIEKVEMLKNDGVFTVSSVSQPLPFDLKPGDSLKIDVCYSAKDTTVEHWDSVLVQTTCFPVPGAVVGSGVTPLITATDIDFGTLVLGNEKCDDLKVTNVGKAPFTLTKQYLLHNTTEFRLSDDSKLPKVLQPGESITLNFCYKPTKVATDSTWTDWDHTLPTMFKHSIKDWSYLRGVAVEPSVQWDRPSLTYKTECNEEQTLEANLVNSTDVNDEIDSIYIEGPDAAEFSIVALQGNYPLPLTQSIPLDQKSQIFVRIKFTRDASKGFIQRHATLVAHSTISKKRPTLELIADPVYADLTVDKTLLDLGLLNPNTPASGTLTFTNPGTADFVITAITVPNGFTLTPLPQVGDHIAPSASIVITVSATSPTEGLVEGDIHIEGQTTCDNDPTVHVKIESQFVKVDKLGHDFGRQFVDCRETPGKIRFMNTGSMDVILTGVGFDGINAGQFEFRNAPAFAVMIDAHTLQMREVVPRGEFREFDVVYMPTRGYLGRRLADLHFFYDYKDLTGSEVSGSELDSLVGTAEFLRDTIAVRDVNANSEFHAATNETFEVPIRLALHNLPANADAYGYMFKIVYRQDLFRFLTNGSITDPAHQFDFVGGRIAEPVEGAKEWDTLYIKAMSNNGQPLTSTEELARLKFQLMVARETTTEIYVVEGAFLDKDGNTLCYIEANHLPGSFLASEFCGDAIVRDMLANGTVPTQIVNFAPNPVTKSAKMDVKVRVADMHVTIEVFNALGDQVETIVKNKVMTIGTHTLDVDASTLPSGTYTIRVTAGDQQQTQMMIVNK